MTPTLQTLLFGLLLFLLTGAVWRLLSRRASLPCPSWLGWLVEMENPLAKNYNATSIIQALKIKPGMRILDAGCGPGRVTIPLAKAVGSNGSVVAIDLQPEMLKRAQTKAKDAGLSNIDFQQLGIGTGKLGTDEYDLVVLVTVLGEIPDRVAALREIHRSLKPGGVLSITEIMFDPHYQGRSTILRLASSAGFRERAFFGSKVSFTVHLEKSPKG